ncbi:acylphosphatase [Branchiibius hedensis]|uniref:Acylphosphatase n=1 Tax=Branchiibius hedensis TaxID=672460 RepID=A0A2Y8ZUQ3_9MICO|nr:acylphosphatase [Branchiibius hedensis]PWJ26953.1 acylphosphatase [Branchiibius hedensis]SSA35764.1 acylphosphatase [Branchiibius hedensis]
MRRVRVVVTGSVQGVGFRWSTRTVADKYGLAGWVRNRSDGAVEAELEGSPEVVDSMLAWLHKGPPSASVSTVDVVEIPAKGEAGFVVEPH